MAMTDQSDENSDITTNGFTLPLNYELETSEISKIILKDRRIIRAITENLVEIPENTYFYGEPIDELGDNHSIMCNVFYVPLFNLDSLPIVFINISDNVTERHLSQVSHHITRMSPSTHEMQCPPPICLMICTDQVSWTILGESWSSEKLPFLREIPCTPWAKQCFLLLKDDIMDIQWSQNPIAIIGKAIMNFNEIELVNNDN